jgi:hexosaminidase
MSMFAHPSLNSGCPMKKIVLTATSLLLLSVLLTAQGIQIIPKPMQATFTRGLPFLLNAATTVGGNTPEASVVAATFAEMLKVPTGYSLKTSAKANIQFVLNAQLQPQLPAEGYQLVVRQKNIVVESASAAGLYYGMQSLLQLLPPETESVRTVSGLKWAIPACEISDYPRFGWRGFMLDVSRHFFPKEDVKRYIDRMAKYKFNVFHWHLTDDEGWRIEIKSLPRLTEVGACRVPRYGRWGHHAAPTKGEPATDCGYYTQEDIREIVAYAAERHIQVMPEIDVPGHSSAAIAAYPELCCTRDTSVPVSPGYRFSEWYADGSFKMLVDNTLNPADPAVYTFLDQVFTEVAALFPFPYIHAGGDECYQGYWEKNADCQALMQREGLKNTHELQAYFTRKVEQIVRAKGKKLIGWDEILEGGLAPGAAVMSWRGLKGGIEAAKMGHEVVMTPNDFLYLDLLQGDPLIEPNQMSYKTVRLKKTYTFEPVPEGVDPTLILGGQGNLWTEKVPNLRQAQYMSFPRAWAIADIFWSPKQRDWDEFTQRMETHFLRLDAAECNYARSAFDPIVTARMEGNQLVAYVESELNGLDFYYTLNETLPDRFSTLYTGPFVVPEGGMVNLRVVSYRAGQPVGKSILLSREELISRVKG